VWKHKKPVDLLLDGRNCRKQMQNIVKTTMLVAALWAAPLHAQVVNLTPTQVRALAVAALENERPDQAAVASDALLKRFPDDPGVLLLRTEAAVLLGDFSNATSFGQRAFWNASNDIQRFNAARLTALAHARQSQDGRAQLWLRAARQFAPSDAASESVARDFQDIRRRNPLSVNLRFGVTPSSNINGGSSSDESNLFGFVDGEGNPLIFQLDEVSQALSGWEVSGSLNLRYRVRTDRTSATFLDFGVSGQTFRLSESSRDRAESADPDDPVTGSDFSTATLNFGVSHRFVLSPDAGITEAGLSFAQSWRGGEENRRFATASLSHTWNVFDTDSFTLSGFSQQQERLENGDRTQVFDVTGTYTTRLDGIGTVSIALGFRDNAAEDEAEDFDAVRYRLGFSPSDPLFGVNLGFNLSYEEREFENVALAGGERRDEITSLSVRAVLSDIEFFGFRPVLTAERTRQDSTTALFDRDFTEFGFDIVSSF
jgi:hypothetical protein